MFYLDVFLYEIDLAVIIDLVLMVKVGGIKIVMNDGFIVQGGVGYGKLSLKI